MNILASKSVCEFHNLVSFQRKLHPFIIEDRIRDSIKIRINTIVEGLWQEKSQQAEIT